MRDSVRVSVRSVEALLPKADRMNILQPEQEHNWLEYHFHFSGEHHDQYRTVGGGEYSFVKKKRSRGNKGDKEEIHYSLSQPPLSAL